MRDPFDAARLELVSWNFVIASDAILEMIDRSRGPTG
jgi:hypothetical protein